MRRASKKANRISAPIHTSMSKAPSLMVAAGERSSSHPRFPTIDRETGKGSIGALAA